MKINTKDRVNTLGYQMVSSDMASYLGLPGEDIPKADKWEIESSVSRFGKEYKFPPKLLDYPEMELELPDIGGNIVEFIDNYSEEKWGKYREQLSSFLDKGIPDYPSSDIIAHNSGWTRYEPVNRKNNDPFSFDFSVDHNNGQDFIISRVKYPREDTLVFDCETFVKLGGSPVMAAAVSNLAWYVWLHPSVINPSLAYRHQLIPLGTDKLVLAHFAKFDSARVLETYDKTLETPGSPSDKPKANIFLCTKSMHMAYCGFSDKQEKAIKKINKGDYFPEWAKVSSPGNLVDAYNFHVQPLIKLGAGDKTLRNIFKNAQHCREFNKHLPNLINYNLKDVFYTFELAKYLTPKYLRSQSHPVTLGGHIILSQSFLPVEENWKNRMRQIEYCFNREQEELNGALTKKGKQLAYDYKNGKLRQEDIDNCPWLSQLDWTPGKSGPTKGLPFWYRKIKKKGITSKGRIAPLILKLSWNIGTKDEPSLSPLVFHGSYKWIFKAYKGFNNAFYLKNGVPGPSEKFPPGWYAKVPHKKGDKENVGTPLAKDYISAIDNGIMCSPLPDADWYLKKARSIAYWTSVRSRVDNYFTWPLLLDNGGNPAESGHMIEPSMMGIHGTCSRRCTESLWLTVSSAKSSIVGSELKGTVRAPSGWRLVGADFDGQETRIAAAFSDAYRWLIHGSTAIGYTQLLGSKKDKTDSHSLLAQYSGLARNIAKTLNFGMLYLSGLSGCAMTIKTNRPELSEDECKQIANKALTLRRGKKVKNSNGTYYYKDGTDSEAYNFMLRLANHLPLPGHLSHLNIDPANPRTPALGSAMSLATQYRYCGSSYLTSRANWGIQSSGVDLLHLLLACLEYLKNFYSLSFRFSFTYHDEVWLLCPENERYMAAYCLQIAHLWTWAYFYKKIGFNDLPWGFQWFSGVNIDTALRKEPDESQITLSNPSPNNNPDGLKFTETLANGEVLDMMEIVEKVNKNG